MGYSSPGMDPTRAERLSIGRQQIRFRRPPSIEKLLDELANRDPSDLELQDERLPYWADVWPCCRALILTLQAHTGLVADKDVIELGSGLGLAGIAAALAGAKVVLTDYSEDALGFAADNWALNLPGPPKTLLIDWRHPPQQLQADVLIASDVAYETRFFEPLVHTFQKLLRPGGDILLTEPRRSIGRGFFPLLLDAGFTISSTTMDVETNGHQNAIDVHHIQRA